MSGLQNDSVGGEHIRTAIDECEIVSIVSAFLTSDRDFRLVIPDFFEMLLKNLLCHSINLFVASNKGNQAMLRLEFAESLHDINVPEYILSAGQGVTGKVGASRSSLVVTSATQQDLDGEEKFNPFLEGRTVFAVPLIASNQLLGVLEFVFDPNAILPSENLVFTIANIFTNYFSLLQYRRECAKASKKFDYLNRVGKAFSVTLELRSILSVVMNLTADALAAEVGAFILFEEDSQVPSVEINWGIALNDLRQIIDPNGKNFLEHILDSEGIISLNSLSEAGFEFLPDAERRLRVDAVIASALHTDQMPAGVFLFANKRNITYEDRQVVFEQEDQILFSIMIEQVKKFVDNYLMYRKIVSYKNFNDNILKSIKSGVISVDLEGNILSSNRMACEISGLGDNLIGASIEKIFPFPVFNQQALTTAMEDGTFPEGEAEYLFERNGQDAILSFVISSLRDSQDKVIGAVITVHDMTEQRMMEKRIRRAEHLAALGELSAGLAHEIKNPLTAIKGFAQLLPYRLDDNDFLMKFSKMITTELMRLNNLTERLLTYALPNVGDFEKVLLSDLLDETVLLVKYQFEKRNIQTVLDIESDLPPVLGNRDRISQVFLNIIINALHAMGHDGTLILRMMRDQYELPQYGRASVIITDFVDNGIGIDKEYVEKLFNPFFTTKENGTGLGLAISYRIIEEHGGLIEVHSAEGEGTTMRVILPVERINV